MFSRLHILHPGVLYAVRVSRIDESWRQRCTMPLAIAILEHLLILLLLNSLLLEIHFCLPPTPIMKPFSSILYVCSGSTWYKSILLPSYSKYTLYVSPESAA